MVGPIDVKQKGGALVGVNYVTLTFDLTHDLDLWFVKVKIAVSKELLSDWCETKRKQIIKSPRSGVTLCFQFVSAASAATSAASAASTTFASHVKTFWAKP